jgi:hypothetical protein
MVYISMDAKRDLSSKLKGKPFSFVFIMHSYSLCNLFLIKKYYARHKKVCNIKVNNLRHTNGSKHLFCA